jgi:hypothetical protein
MSKWIVTVADKDNERMGELENSENYIWINEWVGEAVEIVDMQQVEE